MATLSAADTQEFEGYKILILAKSSITTELADEIPEGAQPWYWNKDVVYPLVAVNGSRVPLNLASVENDEETVSSADLYGMLEQEEVRKLFMPSTSTLQKIQTGLFVGLALGLVFVLYVLVSSL